MKICPICKESLENVTNYELSVVDSNEVFQCSEHVFHRFWVGKNTKEYICWHPEAAEDRYDFFLVWKIEKDKYVPANGVPGIIRSVTAVFKQNTELKSWCEKHEETKSVTDSALDTVAHIRSVQYYMNMLIEILLERARVHDRTKLEPPEKKYFDDYTPLLRNSTYGSDHYKGLLELMKPALEHHYQNNPHHPQYYKKGICGMNLIDLIEMLCDWLAATQRHHDGDIYESIELNQKRFEYSDELQEILLNTLKLIYATR